ncbi:restriction endonuclease [Bradyrhizobium yuanmingense]|uniref:restriction endonuclease n=1 Tax=Bradyrhizobium yuanmingense TaxID=108015 RepID=UPI0023B9910B|nr:restriction endonuclease [Bradyrhizobium yuanmingense]MDF0520644.1 restriction endonuclease [Bradyrhizobium yuanmingense]
MSTETRNRYIEFEQVVADIFRAEGFGVEQILSSKDWGADLLLVHQRNGTAVVEVKLFRTLSLSMDILVRLTARLEHERARLRRDRSVLVTSARIPNSVRRTLGQNNGRLVIYDYDGVRLLAAKHPRLALRLEEILRDIIINPVAEETVAGQPLPSTDELAAPILSGSLSESSALFEEPPRSVGGALCSDLRSTKAGRLTASQFENAGEAALRYIFHTDLVGWRRQNATDTGFSRFDLIARVSSKDDVWRMIRERFQSEYVVFEFKNYSEQIRQGEIHTTEKYLYRTALRGVAFVLSRRAAHASALAAARGALREHGKLIINLSIEDVCSMLTLKDKGGDYNGYLFDKIDEMLMKIER